ncbi:MAG: hypothetical protein M5U28_36085 [Sandaracinaceae bacterium]|nr:hypothetical protein [Sandaracinaceae bacterium]
MAAAIWWAGHDEDTASYYEEERRRRDERRAAAEERVGSRCGHRQIESLARMGAAAVYVVRCPDCGGAEELTIAAALVRPCYLADADGAPCLGGLVLGEDDDERVIARLAATPELDPDLPWAADVACRALVAERPDGCTLEEVGRAMGVTRERARQIEASALEVVRRRLGEAGYSAPW